MQASVNIICKHSFIHKHIYMQTLIKQSFRFQFLECFKAVTIPASTLICLSVRLFYLSHRFTQKSKRFMNNESVNLLSIVSSVEILQLLVQLARGSSHSTHQLFTGIYNPHIQRVASTNSINSKQTYTQVNNEVGVNALSL